MNRRSRTGSHCRCPRTSNKSTKLDRSCARGDRAGHDAQGSSFLVEQRLLHHPPLAHQGVRLQIPLLKVRSSSASSPQATLLQQNRPLAVLFKIGRANGRRAPESGLRPEDVDCGQERSFLGGSPNRSDRMRKALSRQISIGHFPPQNFARLPSAAAIHEQKQWSATGSRRANRQS